MKRGIYLVANFKSQEMCENLIFSIRESGCLLPIRLIHFGGKKVSSNYVMEQAELLQFESFSQEGQRFIANLRSVLTECPLGFLYRFLGLFSDWEQFIYSDNDIVALSNWEEMFGYLKENDLVHADEEYITKGIFNYYQPDKVQAIFGQTALDYAFTAGHIVVRRSDKMIADIDNAVTWFKKNYSIPIKHDQSLLHIASLLGGWKMVNLCKPPHNWLSSWAGDYKNSLQLIHKIQSGGNKISHIHYSGGTPLGNLPIEELLLSNNTERNRLKKITLISMKMFSGYLKIRHHYFKIKKGIVRKFSGVRSQMPHNR